MSKSPKHLNIWHMVHLGHELDEIAAKIGLLAAQFNHGHLDQHLMESTRRQIKKCSERLDAAFNRRSKLRDDI